MPLDPEAAKKQLATFAKGPLPDYRARVGFFESALGIKRGGQSFDADVGKAFRQLGLIKRTLFLRSINGKVGAALERALETAKDRPYQSGMYRQPFRAPNYESFADGNRGDALAAAFQLTRGYQQGTAFLAEWVGYLDPYGFSVRYDLLLSAAIDIGEKDVLRILIQTIRGEHPVGVISRHGIRALLGCSKPEAWAEVERLLLAAQREEGLRQTILESVDELHPEAFKRFLGTIIEHNLLRFTSVSRAVLVWLPGLWEEGDAKSGAKILGRLLEFLNSPTLEPDTAEGTDVYLRLWADAFYDIAVAMHRGERYLLLPQAAARRAAIRLIASLSVTNAIPLVAKALQDPDRSVSSIAVAACSSFSAEQMIAGKLSPILWQIANTWPKKDPGLVERTTLWDLLLQATPLDQTDLVKGIVKELSPTGRERLAARIPKITGIKDRRALALELLADASPNVRSAALTALEEEPLQPGEAPAVEELLRRKASDLRHAALKLLSKQSVEHILASGDRLLASKDQSQRQAGLELMVELFEKKDVLAARDRVLAFADIANLGEAEQALVERFGAVKPQTDLAIENGFGLFAADQLTFASRPEKTSTPVFTSATPQIVESLDDLIHEHRNREVTYPMWAAADYESSVMDTKTLADLKYGFVMPRPSSDYAADRERFPIADLTESWLATHMKDARDPDGQDLVRAFFFAYIQMPHRNTRGRDLSAGFGVKLSKPIRHPRVIATALRWLIHQRKDQIKDAVVLDMLSNVIADLANDNYEHDIAFHTSEEISWRTNPLLEVMLKFVGEGIPNRTEPKDDIRAYQLFRFVDEPRGLAGHADVYALLKKVEARPRIIRHGEQKSDIVRAPSRRPCPLSILDRAFQSGGCTKADIFDQLAFAAFQYYRNNLYMVTSQRGRYSHEFMAVVDEYVANIVEIESTRGDLPTALTDRVGSVRSGVYLPQVLSLLKANVALSARFDNPHSRVSAFHNLLSVSRPATAETPEICAGAFTKAKIKEDRLIELALLAPQWAKAVELAITWDGFADAVWWIHAHTKDEQWGVQKEIKELWEGEISERTPLSGDQLMNGAVDVAWFNRFRGKFDAKRWKKIEDNAKFASQGSGHTRAKLFAQAMTGQVSADALIEKINEKRTPDAVRALGLVPLADPAEIRGRYQVMQDFLVGSRKFGSARQTTEKAAVRVGLENLARTAGYPDPLRLTWDLEAAEVADLRDGKSVVVGEVTVRLFFDFLGEPQIEASKAGTLLKEVPAAAKKLPEIKELVERRTALKKQASRMRMALEEAMQRGDAFQAEELRKLLEHPGLAPMLRNLVFINETSAGFLDQLEEPTGWWRIAHPWDLLQRGDWPQWQSKIFREERIQPFKQVFRELYPMTAQEKESHASTRYGGHQVQPRQTLAILGKRGWVIRAEEGVTKTLHDLGLTAHLHFEETFYTPADIEGLTISQLFFTRSGEWEPIPLIDVPPKAFSETMRDLDLIVSVASMVGVDPEASESTVEMRANVVREMASLLNLKNVTFKDRHAIVAGGLAEYSIHLGSGLVQQRAKGELVILAVRQPQRGRLFLPFIDDDPRTAEIASKVLLLARDKEIKDPTILRQIVSG